MFSNQDLNNIYKRITYYKANVLTHCNNKQRLLMNYFSLKDRLLLIYNDVYSLNWSSVRTIEVSDIAGRVIGGSKSGTTL